MSTVQDARRALLALAATACPTAQAFLGPQPALTAAEVVCIGDAEGDTAPVTLGPRREMEERYEIALTISVTVPGTAEDQVTASDAAAAHLAAIDTALRQVPGENLAVPGVQLAMVAGRWSLTEHAAEETRGARNCTLTAAVAVRARYRLA